MRYSEVIYPTSVLGLSALFLMAGIGKLLDPNLLRIELSHLHVFPEYAVWALSRWIPWVELSCSCGLVSSRWRKGAAFTSVLLSFSFLAVSLSGWILGWSTVCACLGAVSTGWSGISWPLHAGISVIMVLMSISVFIWGEPEA